MNSNHHPFRNVLRRASLGTLAAGLLMAAAGCGANGMDDPALDSDKIDVASTKQELNRNNLMISFSDNRTASNVIVTVDGVDNTTGQRHSDWEAVGGTLPGTSSSPKKLSWMTWNAALSDKLDESYYGNGLGGDTYSIVRVDDVNSSAQFTNLRVTVRATINGACHEDFEDINLSSNVQLYFNGNGASWDGSCWRGNLLRTNP